MKIENTSKNVDIVVEKNITLNKVIFEHVNILLDLMGKKLKTRRTGKI